MKLKILILIIFFAVFIILAFWPSLIGAHYAGIVSCPVLSGNMAGCANLVGHINLIISHISSFKGILSFILASELLVLIIFAALMIFSSFILLVNLREYYRSLYSIKIFALAAAKSRLENLLFSGLKTGILNTKVF